MWLHNEYAQMLTCLIWQWGCYWERVDIFSRMDDMWSHHMLPDYILLWGAHHVWCAVSLFRNTNHLNSLASSSFIYVSYITAVALFQHQIWQQSSENQHTNRFIWFCIEGNKTKLSSNSSRRRRLLRGYEEIKQEEKWSQGREYPSEGQKTNIQKLRTMG